MTDAIQSTTEQQSLRMQRKFDTTPERLFEFLTVAEHLAEWFGPKGVSCRHVELDARVGGAYEIQMVNPDGSMIGLVGRFIQLEAPRLIQMTWRWLREEDSEPGEETLVTIEILPEGNGARLQLTHERFAETSERDRHDNGWSSTLDCLEEHVTSEGRKR